jgi:hypothetical protein
MQANAPGDIIEEFGSIESADGRQVHFHQNGVLDGDLSQLAFACHPDGGLQRHAAASTRRRSTAKRNGGRSWQIFRS